MSLWSRRQAGFIILDGTDSSSTDAGDKIIFNGDSAGVASDAEHFMMYQDSVSDEQKPKYLTEAADGSGDYSKENCFGTDSGWVMRPGSPATGNDNPDADPEILVASRGLRSNGLGSPTARQVTLGNLTDKTKFYPDGDSYSGSASTTAGDICIYLYFNEAVSVIGTPQLQLEQATNLTANFSNCSYLSSSSNLDAGIVCFQIAGSVDTQTSAVTNNTLGVNSDASWTLNSGQITKISGGRLRDETNEDHLVLDDGASTEGPMSYGDIILEDGDIAELTIRASADATMTVS